MRGPLGLDLTSEFAVVPGLNVVRPPTPSCQTATRPSSSAPNANVAGSEPGAAQRLAPGEHASRVTTSIERPEGDRLDVVVRVPRLLWTIVHETKPAIEPRAAIARVGKEEFDDHLADLLLVSLGRPDIELQLELREPTGTSLRISDTVRRLAGRTLDVQPRTVQ